jgi:predicted metalloprotease with PDZ domain
LIAGARVADDRRLMCHRPVSALLLALCAACASATGGAPDAAPGAAAGQPAAPVPPLRRPPEPQPLPPEADMLRYSITLPERQAHRVHVQLSLTDAPAGGFTLAMPVWTPGSYLVREYSRHVLDHAARDDRGAALPVEKLDKNSWRVDTRGARTVHVDYVLYANERSVRTSHVDDRHAFLSSAATFLFVRGREQGGHRVSVEAPAGWGVFTGLPRDGDGWLAPDYDTLVDCPIEVGPHRVLTFEERGVPFRIVLAGEGQLDEAALQRDAQKVVAEVASIFGIMPFDDYTFIIPLVDGGGGGLEHRNSSVCVAARWTLHQKKEYRALLELIAHEFFHAWNVKRFRPAALGPFDYDRENYTRDLWVAEGITSYYDLHSLARAGFCDKPSDYLDVLAGGFREIAELPGARRMSLARASHDAWIKYYRPDENSRNASVSYYTKGGLVALLLDLRIRRTSGGARTLADALRLGWKEYTEVGAGFPEGAMQDLASRTAGADLGDFFARHVEGTAPLQPDDDLAFIGLQLVQKPAASERSLARDAEGFLLAPDLGITVADEGGMCRITAVLEDGPAYAAGLNAHDLLLAVNGMRCSAATLADRLDRTRGEAVELALFRGQELRRVQLRPRLLRLADWKLLPVEAPTDAQRAAFRTWCGMDFPAAAPAQAPAAPATPPPPLSAPAAPAGSEPQADLQRR